MDTLKIQCCLIRKYFFTEKVEHKVPSVPDIYLKMKRNEKFSRINSIEKNSETLIQIWIWMNSQVSQLVSIAGDDRNHF